MDYLDALKYFKNNNIKFNIIFLDPPYKDKILSNILELINNYDLLFDDGIIVLEYDSGNIEYDKYELIKNKKYGNKYIMILKRQ